MDKPPAETLAQYVTRVMKEKDLSVRDVQALSGNKITAGYVSNIMKGSAINPSIKKLDALAVGLGVDREGLFRVAQVGDPGGSKGRKSDNSAHTLLIIRLMEKVVRNPRLTEALQGIVKLSPDDLDALMKFLKTKKKGSPDRDS